MFLLDSLLISGLRWTLDTIRTAADHELHDDAALRERLLDAEMRRELGEIDDEAFRTIEADVLARLRAIKDARGAGTGVLEFPSGPSEAGGDLTVEASIAGDFHDVPAGALPPPEPAQTVGRNRRRPARRTARPQPAGRARRRRERSRP